MSTVHPDVDQMVSFNVAFVHGPTFLYEDKDGGLAAASVKSRVGKSFREFVEYARDNRHKMFYVYDVEAVEAIEAGDVDRAVASIAAGEKPEGVNKVTLYKVRYEEVDR